MAHEQRATGGEGPETSPSWNSFKKGRRTKPTTHLCATIGLCLGGRRWVERRRRQPRARLSGDLAFFLFYWGLMIWCVKLDAYSCRCMQVVGLDGLCPSDTGSELDDVPIFGDLRPPTRTRMMTAVICYFQQMIIASALRDPWAAAQEPLHRVNPT